MRASDIAAAAVALLEGPRQATHGDKLRNHANIAALWDGYAARRWGLAPGSVKSPDVAALMVLLKVARTLAGDHNPDDYTDMCGYSAIMGELAAIEAARPADGEPIYPMFGTMAA